MAHQADEPTDPMRLQGSKKSPIASLAHKSKYGRDGVYVNESGPPDGYAAAVGAPEVRS
jgi:hypothetical protein